MFQDTMNILNKGYYSIGNKQIKLKLSRAQMEAAEVYLPREVQAVSAFKGFQHVHVLGRCGYGCENMDSFSLARKQRELYFCDS